MELIECPIKNYEAFIVYILWNLFKFYVFVQLIDIRLIITIFMDLYLEFTHVSII